MNHTTIPGPLEPSLTIRRLVRGVALCAILLELAASSVTKPVHEKAASYYAWDTIRPLGAIAHRLCRLIWIILHRGVRYEERGQERPCRTHFWNARLALVTWVVRKTLLAFFSCIGHIRCGMISLCQRKFKEAPAGPGAFLFALTV